jgi:endonuclease/exonuclease/phosphatase family metal-dependent hydrolase
MKNFIGGVILLIVAGALIHCSSGSDDVTTVSSVKMVTFNTGLAQGYVQYYSERRELIVSAIQELDADIVCLQEVWLDDDMNAILAATQQRFPYSYWERTEQEYGGTCTDAELAPLQVCLAENCADVSPDQIGACVLANCGDAFAALSTPCRDCLISNLGNHVEDILAMCSESGEGGGKWAYEGRNGVLLLSRYPIAATDMLLLPSYLNRRVVLHARVDVSGFGEISVFGTHLTPELGDSPPYGGEFGSWEQEQAEQIRLMHAWVQTLAPPDARTALLGDMNCGPEKTDINAELPQNYALFNDQGWTSPYAESVDAQCSFCQDNPLVLDEYTSNILIDHILLQHVPASDTVSSNRILDQRYSVQVEGETLDLPLSDHYGIAVVLQR